jgi:predicted metal-dependent peptidase
MNTTHIDPSTLPVAGVLATAMRQVSKHWPLAYSKLLSLDWVWSNRTPYGATDGRTLWLNPDGIKRIEAQANSVGLCAFLLVHESLHALLGHGWRVAKMADPHTANVAADYIINAMIADRNKDIGKEVFRLIDGVLLDPELSGDKSVEQLYRELLKTNKQDTPKQNKQDDNKDTGDDEQADGEGDDQAAGDSGDGAGDPDGDGDDGPPDGPPAADDSLDDFVGTGAADNLKPESDSGESDEEVIASIEEDNDRLLIAEHIATQTGGDTGRAGQRINAQRFRGPALDWPQLLREWMHQRSRNGWGSPFNPAIYGGAGLVSAGRRSRKAGDIVLVIDTSGSVPDSTYARFLSEAQAVLDELKPDRLHLLSVSHYVCDFHTLEPGDLVPDRLIGGGGTLFQPAFDWVIDQGIDVDMLVYLTDGLASDRTCVADPGYPVLWASTILQQSDYPFGEVVEVTP